MNLLDIDYEIEWVSTYFRHKQIVVFRCLQTVSFFLHVFSKSPLDLLSLEHLIQSLFRNERTSFSSTPIPNPRVFRRLEKSFVPQYTPIQFGFCDLQAESSLPNRLHSTFP